MVNVRSSNKTLTSHNGKMTIFIFPPPEKIYPNIIAGTYSFSSDFLSLIITGVQFTELYTPFVLNVSLDSFGYDLKNIAILSS